MRPSSPSYRLTAGSVLAALMLATATAAALTALLFAVTTLLSPFGGGVAVAIPGLFLAFLFACPVWLAGLVVIGGPFWWMLHRAGVRSSRTAALAGALLTLSVAGGYVVLSSSPPDSHSNSAGAWTFVAGLAAIGGAAGRVLAKVAYPKGAIG